MDWLVPAIVATLSNTLILSLVYLYLYTQEREQSLQLFLASWTLYTLRFVFMLLFVYWNRRWMLIANQTVTLLSAHLLLQSVRLWLGKAQMSRIWSITTVAGLIWIVAAAFSDLLFTGYTIPSFFYVGALYIAAGVSVLRGLRHRSAGVYVVAITLIVWGIHKMDYPFLRPLEWFAPWGYLIGAIAAVITAVGIILIYFERAKYRLNELVSEKDVLVREVHHRVKNNLSIIDSLLHYHLEQVRDEQSKEVLEKLTTKVSTFALIHDLLYRSESLEHIDFVSYLRQLVGQLVAAYGESPDTVHYSLPDSELYIEIDLAKNIGLIVNELVSNACKYGVGHRQGQRIDLILERTLGDRWRLIVRDNGPGMPEDSVPESPGMSGLYLVRMLAEELSGSMEFGSGPGAEIRIEWAMIETSGA